MAILERLYLADLEKKNDPPAYPYGMGRDGYGRKIATQWKVRLPGNRRWRRVYCCITSNVGTCYVTAGDDWIVIL